MVLMSGKMRRVWCLSCFIHVSCFIFTFTLKEPLRLLGLIQVLLWPATQGIFKSGNMSAL